VVTVLYLNYFINNTISLSNTVRDGNGDMSIVLTRFRDRNCDCDCDFDNDYTMIVNVLEMGVTVVLEW